MIVDRLRSFRFAFAGLLDLLRSEPNARIHAAATVVVITVGYFSRLTAIEWSLLVLAIALVVISEAFNTALEVLADRVTTDIDEQIRQAKDFGAAATLLAAIASITIGLLIFGPRLWSLLN